MKKKKRTLGFALGSGGSRGVAHIGFLQATEEAGIRPDFITGCSMGSVVGAAYAAGATPAEMREAALKLRPIDLVDLTTKPGGLFDTRKMRRALTKFLGEKTFAELKIPFRCVAVDLYTQEIFTFSEGSVMDAVVASSSIPAIFKPLEKDGKRFVDGGVLERVPVSELKEMGADRIVAVDVLGRLECRAEKPNAVTILTQIIDLMDNQRTRARRREHEKKIDLWIEPDLGTMSQYTFKNLEYAYEQGYKAGTEYVERIRELIR